MRGGGGCYRNFLLSSVLRGMVARHEDADVSLLQSLVHHQVVVTNTDEAQSLQGGILNIVRLVIKKVVDGLEDSHLGF